MAGQKETPRQKMIGMMYLVLTALLALQVSNAVLEKFAIMNGTMVALAKEGDQKNQEVLSKIISDSGANPDPKIKKAVDDSKEVRDLTTSTLKSIEELKDKMIATTGSASIDEKLINDHSSKVAAMMIDKKSPEGQKFVQMLDTYVKRLNELSGINPPLDKLTKGPEELEMFKGNSKHANKDYLTFTFENTPPVAAIASVTQIQTEILDYENKALTELSKKAGAQIVKFDKVVPMVRPKSSIVAAGATYEADMFITASSSALEPEFMMDGKKLEGFTDPGTGVKMGKVKFPTKGGGYDKDGYAKHTFTAQIVLNNETYPQTVEYIVAQPVIKVTTGNAPTLYMNCGNSVNIEVPALGTDYKPSFSSSGAKIITSGNPGKVTIVPKQRKIKVAVNNAGVSIGDVAFDVKNVPLPKFVAKENSGKPVDMKNGVKGTSLTGLRIAAEPDENFKQEVPKDAVYRIRSMDVIHARGTAPINRMTATNEVLDLGSWRAGFRPGDQIVIEIKTVTRNTYTGETEKVGISSEILRVPIN